MKTANRRRTKDFFAVGGIFRKVRKYLNRCHLCFASFAKNLAF
jgi:rRNA maturation endonuclease Nob1